MPAPATLASNEIIHVLKTAASQGMDVDKALDQLAALVEANPRKSLTGIKTEIGLCADGSALLVGWDTCSECHQHVSNCDCPRGPVCPPKIKQWATEWSARYSTATEAVSKVGAAPLPTPVDSPENSEGPFSPEGGSVSRKKANPPSAQGTAGVPLATCSGCGVTVTGDDADQNDDGSWTCFPCQTAGEKA